MDVPKVMSREEVFRHIEEIGRAALGGHPLPEEKTGREYMRREDMGDAMAAFSRKVAERFNTIPGKITDDVEGQEMIQAHLDRIMGDLAVSIEKTVRFYEG